MVPERWLLLRVRLYNSFNPCNSVGMVPCKWFEDRSIKCNRVAFPSSGGTYPDKLFSPITSLVSVLMFLIERGIGPESLLLSSKKTDRFLKFPMESGIPPVKTLLDKSSLLRDSSNPISFGMKPESLLPRRKRMDRFLKFPMEAGIKPVRLFCCRVISLSMKKGLDQRAGFEKGKAKISFSSFQLNSGFHRLKRYLTSQVD
uniref:Uncharacterized protein n=1 Tax=Salix viminalis TaxID=40686 RepID=A0A6N2LJ29_SALVM